MFMKGYKNKYQGPHCRCRVSLSSETAPFGTSENIVQLKQACHHVSFPPPHSSTKILGIAFAEQFLQTSGRR